MDAKLIVRIRMARFRAEVSSSFASSTSQLSMSALHQTDERCCQPRENIDTNGFSWVVVAVLLNISLAFLNHRSQVLFRDIDTRRHVSTKEGSNDASKHTT